MSVPDVYEHLSETLAIEKKLGSLALERIAHAQAVAQQARGESEMIMAEMWEVRKRTKELRERSLTLRHASRLLRDGTKKCIMKTCSCGKTYRPSEWFDLPLVGWQAATPIVSGEMRNCTCGSTVTITRRTT